MKSRAFWIVVGFLAFTVLVALMCNSAETGMIGRGFA